MNETTCPFLATQDGIMTPYGCMCSIHPDEKGKPQFPCIKINCKVFKTVSDLEEDVLLLKARR